MDPYDVLEEHARRAGRWGEVEQLRDLVRRLTAAYQVAGADNMDLLREALAAVEAMPPPPWDNPQ